MVWDLLELDAADDWEDEGEWWPLDEPGVIEKAVMLRIQEIEKDREKLGDLQEHFRGELARIRLERVARSGVRVDDGKAEGDGGS